MPEHKELNADALRISDSIGRYQLKEKLPHAEFGVAYRAWDTALAREVLVKLLLVPDGLDRDGWAQLKWRFLQESRAVGRLNHPDVVSVYDAGESGNFVYTVMEYRRDDSLLACTEPEHLLPVAQVLDVAAAVAGILDYAHRRWVIHRDIKPRNILYDKASGRVRLTHFGLARLVDSTRTRTGVVLGQPSVYMSPEQLSGKKVDHRTDIYSLGMTLYQLLTGTLPFQAGSLVELMAEIAYKPPPPVDSLRPELSVRVADLVDQALNKQPAERFATARKMGKAIARCRTRRRRTRRRRA